MPTNNFGVSNILDAENLDKTIAYFLINDNNSISGFNLCVYRQHVKRLLSSNDLPAKLNEVFADEIIDFFLAHDQNVAVPNPNVVLKDKLANALMQYFENFSQPDRVSIPDHVPLFPSKKSKKKRKAVALQKSPKKQKNLSKHLMQSQEAIKQTTRCVPSPLQLEPPLPSYHTEAEKDTFDAGWQAQEILDSENFLKCDEIMSEDEEDYSQASTKTCMEKMINSFQ
jgi:hypothetical protein